MSSMRNAVQRRNHRERGQPEERQKWGLLEKKKDYSLRAKDHNAKKAKLSALKQKVLEKNPDEFYFGMLSRKIDTARGKDRTGTVNGKREAEGALSVDAVRLFKTQDLGYVRTQRNVVAKEVEELERKVKGIKGEGRKVVFCDAEDDLRRKFEEGKNRMEEEENEELEVEERHRRTNKAREEDKLEAKLAVARERFKALSDAEQALEMQRARMAKSTTVGGVNKAGVKFKVRERKR